MNLKLPFFLFFLFTSFLSLSAQSWQKLGGPFGGGGIVYSGKPGFLFMILEDNELYRSSDGGDNWQKMPVTPVSSWTSPLVVAADGNLYAGQGSKIFRSTDNGETWAQISSVAHISIFALPGGELLVGSYQGLKRSIDNGQTWTTVANTIQFAEKFAYNPNSGEVYAWEDYVSSGSMGKLWRSKDNGLTWDVMLESIDLLPYQFAFSPTGGIFIGAEDVIWRSLDNGVTWTSMDPMLPQSFQEVSVAVSSSGRLFAFEWYLSKYSDDNGNTWKTLEDSGRNPLSALSSTPDGKIFGTRSYGSLQRSEDNGATWQFSANGILKSAVINLQHIDGTHMLALTGDGLFYSKNSGDSWDLIWEKITENAPIYGGFQLGAAPDGSWYLWDGFNLLKFTDEGQSYTTLQVPGVNSSNFDGIRVSPINGKIYLTSWNGLYSSIDGGQSWDPIFTNYNYENVVFMPDGSLIFSDFYGIYNSLDEGQTLTKISNRRIWPDPLVVSSNGTLYGIDSGNPSTLFTSLDGGLTWDSISINYTFPIYRPMVNNVGYIYAVDNFDNVVLHSVDGGHSFNPLPIIGDGTNFISDISINPAQYLFSHQEGDGIYRTASPTTQVKLLSGRTFHDLDGACSLSAPDSLLRGKIVKASSNGQTVYGYSNTSGQYIVPVTAGDYQISIEPPNDYWAGCGSNTNIPNNNSIGIVDSADVGLRILTECPYAEVDVSAPFLRRCFESQIFVQYSNNGTIPAENASLEITLDTLLDFNSASQPYTQNGQTYTFQLGNIPVGGQGNLRLKVTPSCNAALGYIHCLEAHIYPDELCPPISGAHLVTSAVCLGDSVQLRIDNLGEAGMTQPLDWYALDFDHFTFPFGPIASGQFQLNAGEHFTKNIASGFDRLDFYAEQDAQYPYNVVSHTQIQGCGTPAGGSPLSIINDDEQGPFIDKFCVRNIGAFDPNDKQGFPEGLTNQGYIERGQTLEYLIRFQNTGTDTAFNVTIRDTLSALLDPATIRLGATSHPCELRMMPSGTLMLVFEHILLPDSNINEAASHGFAQFTIEQKSDNAFGSSIRNRAAIYFDFNPPVITNQTLHTVGIPLVSGTVPEPDRLPILSFSPNPFHGSTLLTVNDPEGVSQSFIFELFDPMGKKVRSSTFTGNQMQIPRENLPNGAYPFVLKSTAGIVLGSGTLVAQ
jgi:uncharacterized repeat protein (TIGR01451 family)